MKRHMALEMESWVGCVLVGILCALLIATAIDSARAGKFVLPHWGLSEQARQQVQAGQERRVAPGPEGQGVASVSGAHVTRSRGQ
jgi:hypothetical protein